MHSRARWVRSAVAGLIGGLVAAGAMSLAHEGFSLLAPEPAAAPARPAPDEEDATVKVATG